MTVTNNIYQKQIKYHVFNAVTNSELTELVPVFIIWPAFPTSVKKVNTSFKNVWRSWGPTLLAALMNFCPLGPTNFKNSGIHICFWYTGTFFMIELPCQHAALGIALYYYRIVLLYKNLTNLLCKILCYYLQWNLYD